MAIRAGRQREMEIFLASGVFLRYNTLAFPGVAQLVARVVWDHEAAGSIPVTRTNKGL